jgi:uncharacterized membrane protein
MNKKEHSNLLAFVGVFLTIIGFIIVYAIDRKNRYTMHYAKQGLVLFVILIIVSLVVTLFNWIPLIGQIIKFILLVGWLILWIIGIIYSLSDKEKDIPIVGTYAKMIKF